MNKFALTLGLVLLALGVISLGINELAAAIFVAFGVVILLLVISEPPSGK